MSLERMGGAVNLTMLLVYLIGVASGVVVSFLFLWLGFKALLKWAEGRVVSVPSSVLQDAQARSEEIH